jgi:ABC-type uncharacterized transport system substrate-binding protein
MRQACQAGALAAGLILLGSEAAWPHPHVYLVYSIVLPLGPESVERVGFVFTFDAPFSGILLRDAGQGDAETLSRNHARMLQQIPHEIEVTYNGTPVEPEAPTDLHVSNAGGTAHVPIHDAAPHTPPTSRRDRHHRR